MSLIYNATFDSQTRVLSLLDKAGNVISSCEVPSKSNELTLTATADNSSVKLTMNGALPNTFEVNAGSGWTAYKFGTVIPLNTGQSCKWRCSAHPKNQSYSSNVQFVMTGKIEASGNCNSMLSSDFENITSLSMYKYAFSLLFYGCTALTKAPDLPATTLSDYCYYRMFDGCQSLKEVRISATTTASNALNGWLYNVSATGDFYCDPNATIFPSGISGIPSGWTRWVYGAEDTGTTTTMYHNGASETVRVGTSSYGVCYALQGWVGFKSLSEMHALGYTLGEQTVVTLYEDEHPMSVYACDVNDDDGFTETMYDIGDGKGYLTIERQNEKRYYVAPTPFTGLTLKATENSFVTLNRSGYIRNTYRVDTGYGWRDYTLGTEIYLSAGRICRWDCSNHPTTQDSSNYVQFVMTGKIEASGNCLSLVRKNFENVSTVPKYAFANLFNACTALTKAPELPATTLNAKCYSYMFYKCASLTKAPALPATSLPSDCYNSMFFDCSNLKEVRVSAKGSLGNSVHFWLLHVSPTGDFYCDPNTNFPSGESGIPSGWSRFVLGAEDTGNTTAMHRNGATETVMVGTSDYGVCYALQGWAGFKTLSEMHALGYTLGAQTPLTMYHGSDPVSAYSCDANIDDGFTETMYDAGDGKGYLDIATQNANGYTLTAPNP